MQRKSKKDVIHQIKEWQKDPEFIREAYEFIRYHTSHRQMPKGKL